MIVLHFAHLGTMRVVHRSFFTIVCSTRSQVAAGGKQVLNFTVLSSLLTLSNTQVCSLECPSFVRIRNYFEILNNLKNLFKKS